MYQGSNYYRVPENEYGAAYQRGFPSQDSNPAIGPSQSAPASFSAEYSRNNPSTFYNNTQCQAMNGYQPIIPNTPNIQSGTYSSTPSTAGQYYQPPTPNTTFPSSQSNNNYSQLPNDIQYQSSPYGSYVPQPQVNNNYQQVTSYNPPPPLPDNNYQPPPKYSSPINNYQQPSPAPQLPPRDYTPQYDNRPPSTQLYQPPSTQLYQQSPSNDRPPSTQVYQPPSTQVYQQSPSNDRPPSTQLYQPTSTQLYQPPSTQVYQPPSGDYQQSPSNDRPPSTQLYQPPSQGSQCSPKTVYNNCPVQTSQPSYENPRQLYADRSSQPQSSSSLCSQRDSFPGENTEQQPKAPSKVLYISAEERAANASYRASCQSSAASSPSQHSQSYNNGPPSMQSPPNSSNSLLGPPQRSKSAPSFALTNEIIKELVHETNKIMQFRAQKHWDSNDAKSHYQEVVNKWLYLNEEDLSNEEKYDTCMWILEQLKWCLEKNQVSSKHRQVFNGASCVVGVINWNPMKAAKSALKTAQNQNDIDSDIKLMETISNLIQRFS